MRALTRGVFCDPLTAMGTTMRLGKLAPALLILIVSGMSSAQGWTEFIDLSERFSINVPAEPTVEETTHMGERGGTYPARVYTTEDGPNSYSVTVAHYVGALPTVVKGSIAHAAWNVRKRGGTVTYDAFAQVDRIGGHQLQITNADQSRTYVAIHMHKGRLYILEARVPPGSPPPVQFQQSLVILDEEGSRIRYAVDEFGNRTVRIAPED
jgi:hypothetical protein